MCKFDTSLCAIVILQKERFVCWSRFTAVLNCSLVNICSPSMALIVPCQNRDCHIQIVFAGVCGLQFKIVGVHFPLWNSKPSCSFCVIGIFTVVDGPNISRVSSSWRMSLWVCFGSLFNKGQDLSVVYCVMSSMSISSSSPSSYWIL